MNFSYLTLFRYIGSLSALVLVFALPSIVTMTIKYKDGSLTARETVLYSSLVLLGFVNFVAQFV